jgi:hypothetical protein
MALAGWAMLGPAAATSPADVVAYVQANRGMCPAAQQYIPRVRDCAERGEVADLCLSDLAFSGDGAGDLRTIGAALADYRDGAEPLNQALDQTRSVIRNVVTAVDIPGLGGVVDDTLPGYWLSYLAANELLEDPQSLGMSATLPELWILRGKVSLFAAPDPEVSPVIRQALIDRDLGELALRRESELELTDDYLLKAELSLAGEWFGRDMDDHPLDQTRLIRTTFAGFDIGTIDTETAKFSDLGGALQQIHGDQWAEDPSRIELVACAVDAVRRLDQTADERAGDAPLNEFWKLIHNQPQLGVSYRGLQRDGFVGADSHGYRVRFSTGLFNNVTFMKLFPGCRSGLRGDRCDDIFKWLTAWPTFKYGVGLSVYYESGNLADIEINLNELGSGGGLLPIFPGDDDAEPIRVDGGDYTRYGWSLGATLRGPTPERPDPRAWTVRIDGGMDYFRYERQPARLDHDVARVVLTLRRGEVEFPLYLMHRTDTEFGTGLVDDLVIGLGTSWGLF